MGIGIDRAHAVPPWLRSLRRRGAAALPRD
jgi:hypothetical protein